MSVEITKMSSKGQVVIPQSIREELSIDEGTLFAIMSNKDCIVLKKVATPSKEELFKALDKFAEHARKKVDELGIKESDVVDIIHRRRKIEARARH